ncbi:MAG: cation transporter [Clostridia bacterium]|nr:cation transporter [Clostridia bacterium]
MLPFLIRRFIRDADQLTSPAVRRAYGTLCGALGIALNLLLFGGKLAAGLLSASIAVTADAFNNLSDAGSSLITLAGFRLAGKQPDPDHPFGHGRIEYLSGFFVALLILLMGFELLQSSFARLLRPTPPNVTPTVLLILAASVAVKLYMAAYNRSIGERIDSAALRATSADSLGDAVSTSVVLLSALLYRLFGWNLDGPCGLLVAGLIFLAGFRAAKETLDPLLGQPAEPEFVARVTELVLAHPAILGMHDLIIHDYGPGRRFVSLHAEVSSKEDLVPLHDLVDNLEKQLAAELGCQATIHMDPVAVGDPLTRGLQEKTAALLREIHPKLSMHDFRIVTGPTHTNLIFDVVIPYDFPLTERALREAIETGVAAWEEPCFVVLTIDRMFTG